MNILLSLLFLIQQTPDSLPVDTTQVIEVIRPAPPTEVIAKDTPNDAGGGIFLQWKISADDGKGLNSVMLYNIF